MNILDVPVFYISMDISTQQHEYVEGFLAQKGFKSVTRLPGVISDKKSMGVALAHQNALKHCLKAVETPFIILEGDVAPWGVRQTLQIPKDAHAIYLGVSQWGLKNGKGIKAISASVYNDDLYRVWNMLAAHAIMYVDAKYVRFLIQAIDAMIYMGTNQDKARAETQKYWNIYATKMPMFFQTGVHLKETRFELPGRGNIPIEKFYQ